EIGLALSRRPVEFGLDPDQPGRCNQIIVTELQTAERAARIGRAPANRREHVLAGAAPGAERAAEVGADIRAGPIVSDRGCGLGVEGGQDAGSLLRIPDFLRDAHVVSAPRSVLRRKYADAAAVADLVDVVAYVDHVEPDCNWQSVPAIGKFMRQAGIDLPIGREVLTVGAGQCRPQTAAVDKGCTRGGAVQPATGVGPPVCDPSRTRVKLFMVGVDVVVLDVDKVVGTKEGLV